jgi:hypothetical protein
MELNLNFPIKGLDGEPMLDQNNSTAIAGKVFANILVSGTGGDVIKMYDWALALYKGEVITLDNSDEQMLKKFITESTSMTILLKHNLLESFNHK